MLFYTNPCQIGAELVRQFRERVSTQKISKERMIKANSTKAQTTIFCGYTKAEYVEAKMRNDDTEKERGYFPSFSASKSVA